MRVAQLQNFAPTKRNIAFGDDCGHIPDAYRPKNAMSELKNRGYIIEGPTTREAFAKLYDDVNITLRNRASKPDAMWINDYKNSSYGEEIKYTVRNWELPRETFSGLLTRFWDKNKTTKFNNIKAAVTNFLTNSEGMQKPNFFQMFMSKFSDYLDKQSVLTDVIEIFLKDGRHRLR